MECAIMLTKLPLQFYLFAEDKFVLFYIYIYIMYSSIKSIAPNINILVRCLM